MRSRRPVALRRTWLFVPGADRTALAAAANSGADVLIQELEDFVPAGAKEQARALTAGTMAAWRDAGAVPAVRINPLTTMDGLRDLETAVRSGAEAILLPKTRHANDVIVLDNAITRLERDLRLSDGGIEIVPNIETARALLDTLAIATAASRVSACLVASEDMAADLGAEREPDGRELIYVRERFIVECVAAGTVAIDCPYTWSDVDGAVSEARMARRLGYVAKSLVDPSHARPINAVFTPSAEQAEFARQIVEAFEAARTRGEGRAEVDGSLVELPTYLNAKRTLERAEAFAAAGAPLT